jgi:hypothetical protein
MVFVPLPLPLFEGEGDGEGEGEGEGSASSLIDPSSTSFLWPEEGGEVVTMIGGSVLLKGKESCCVRLDVELESESESFIGK